MPTALPDTERLHATCVLRAPTPPSWARAAAAHLPELLIEQAHLEKKAAAAAIRFLFRVDTDHGTQQALSKLAREEMLHFERTLELLARRRIPFAPQSPSSYAERLKAACAPVMPDRLLDELLVAALIEARSHDRMEALADALLDADPEAAAFYRQLVAAEARHRCVYLDLAAEVASVDATIARFERLAAVEAAIVGEACDVPRLHSGHGGPADAAAAGS